MKNSKRIFIPIDFKFYYENADRYIFDIKLSSFNEKDKNKEDKIKKYEKSNKVKLCFSIKDFIKIFPDFNKIQTNDDKDGIFDIQEKMKIPEGINKYINIIKEKPKTFNETNLEIIMEEIYDYLMMKIFDKCCLNRPNEFEKNVYKKCISLSWTKPKHYELNIFIGNAEKDMAENIRLFVQEKSIRKKLIISEKINKSIISLIEFDKRPKNKVDIGIDQIAPVLNNLH